MAQSECLQTNFFNPSVLYSSNPSELIIISDESEKTLINFIFIYFFIIFWAVLQVIMFLHYEN
ncbi:MAG: hypothetical protein A2Y25_00440 [Candidatus Melainabacteria bacterium GWF2_37_15]|nr:MAG: hypothetical protein A2Y25_00440 [Candidatus Melainabacteria bacterium GWF2_37_15]